MTQEALKLALEALKAMQMYAAAEKKGLRICDEAIIAAEEALAQTERPVDCERCNRLEEQAYDLVGKLRVANIKLSMQPQRTWVGLTDDDCKGMSTGDKLVAMWADRTLKEKNT